jgi:Domain of unknown function (DUF4281)
MTPEQVFSVVNTIALLAWLPLAALPRQAWVERAVAGLGVPALLAVVYVVLIATQWSGSAGGFSTLAGVAQLFADPWLLLAGWVHYLCFDLLVGCWEVQDARARRVPHWLVVPCLLLTFMFGPAGWLLYRGVRARCRPAATYTGVRQS